MSRTVHVDMKERAYDIRIGCGLNPGESVDPVTAGRALVVSDSNVAPLFGAACEAAFRDRGFQVARVVVPAGEKSKSLDSLKQLYNAAAGAGLDRSSLVVALGGGMIGDLAGLAAATYLRGIRLVQVPTTLLAMVDSSVGGKTAVNLPEGKNLVGVFWQPVGVAADLLHLRSLPEREYRSGLAEVVKYGVIWDAVLFDTIEKNVGCLLDRDVAALEPVVARCCEIKAEVVALDERETGVRSILNFGHTLGHALEQTSGYEGLLHGEAVAIGMVYAAAVSVAAKRFSPKESDRMVGVLHRMGLPLSAKEAGIRADWAELRKAMAADKKSLNRTPRLVLAERLGSVAFGCEVAEDTLERCYVGGRA